MLPLNEMTRFHTFLSSCLEVGGKFLFVNYMEALFLLKNPHRKEGLPEVKLLYTSSIKEGCHGGGDQPL